MCRTNDKIRQIYSEQIANLKKEYANENSKLEDIERAKKETKQLIDEAQRAINYLGECDLGGDKVIDSVKKSQQGYKERKNYYDEYIIKCKKAIEEINTEKQELIRVRNLLPTNCGFCSECELFLNKNNNT